MIRPQRIVHDLKPGSLLKRAGLPRHSEATADAAELPQRPRKPDGDAGLNYLIMVRSLPCLSCGMEPSEAAHVRFASAAFGKASGLQKKPDDKWALPLCSACHRLAKTAQHNRNEREFWGSLGIDPLPCCEQLYAARGDFPKMAAIVHVTIAGRNKS